MHYQRKELNSRVDGLMIFALFKVNDSSDSWTTNIKPSGSNSGKRSLKRRPIGKKEERAHLVESSHTPTPNKKLLLLNSSLSKKGVALLLPHRQRRVKKSFNSKLQSKPLATNSMNIKNVIQLNFKETVNYY